MDIKEAPKIYKMWILIYFYFLFFYSPKISKIEIIVTAPSGDKMRKTELR